MVRLSKQTRKRSVSYKRPKVSGKQVVQNEQKNRYKNHVNAVSSDSSSAVFIPKVD